MTSRERMAAAMRRGRPDRVPVMCQLALGHYFLHAGLDAIEVWHDGGAFAEALLRLQKRYRFDGILVNLPGREPGWREAIARIETMGRDRHVVWRNGRVTVCPPDDNPHVFLPDRRTRFRPRFEDVDPDRLYYVEPHDLSGVTYPCSWGLAEEPAPKDAFFPSWHWDTLRHVRAKAPEVSVHGEVFSPFSQLLELLGPDEGLVALKRDAGRFKACLEALCAGTTELMCGHARAGADAVLVSSAYAGAGLVSPPHYRDMVLPFEKSVIADFKSEHPEVPVYTHTCGAISDRLELLAESGTDGIDTLDPPPLGDVELADAKGRVGDRLFLKGNVDPVHTVLEGTPAACFEDARRRIEVAKGGGGYVLSTACSVPPGAPPENVERLAAAAEAFGAYD
jgi:uroporphyrinogen-III decarboxylase